MKCVGWPDRACGRVVPSTLGGAWCEHCRPVDLTGGVSPGDVAPSRNSRGFVRLARAPKGSVPNLLRAAGWREESGWWIEPATGRRYTKYTARMRMHARATASVGRPRAVDDATALRWVERVDAGESLASIAEWDGVHVSTVSRYVQDLRRVLGAVA